MLVAENSANRKILTSKEYVLSLTPCLMYICIAPLSRWPSFHDENLLSAIFELLREKGS